MLQQRQSVVGGGSRQAAGRGSAAPPLVAVRRTTRLHAAAAAAAPLRRRCAARASTGDDHHSPQQPQQQRQPQHQQPRWKWENSDDAVGAYGALLAILGAGALAPGLHSVPWADLPYFVGLAATTIYIGAHRAVTSGVQQKITIREVRRPKAVGGEERLALPTSARALGPNGTASANNKPKTPTHHTSHQHPPPTNSAQGLLAPLALSASLFGLYLLLKYTDFDLSTFLAAYFWLLSTVALGGAAAPLLKRAGDALGQPTWRFTGEPLVFACVRALCCP